MRSQVRNIQQGYEKRAGELRARLATMQGLLSGEESVGGRAEIEAASDVTAQRASLFTGVSKRVAEHAASEHRAARQCQQRGEQLQG